MSLSVKCEGHAVVMGSKRSDQLVELEPVLLPLERPWQLEQFPEQELRLLAARRLLMESQLMECRS